MANNSFVTGAVARYMHAHYVNPATLGEPGGQPVPPASRYAFYRSRDALLTELMGGSVLAATHEAL